MEKVAREEVQLHVADLLVNDGVVVGDDAFLRVAKEQCAGTFEFAGGGAGASLGADGGELFVDGVSRDEAARHVDKIKARALAEETDGEIGGGKFGKLRVERWELSAGRVGERG